MTNNSTNRTILVYNSKGKILFYIAIYGLVLIGGLYLSIFKRTGFGYVLIVLSALLIYGEILEFQKAKVPKFTITSEGFRTDDNIFYSWIDITNLRTKLYSGSRSMNWCLEFENKGERVSISIDYINIEREMLLNHLNYFKSQSVKENNQEQK